MKSEALTMKSQIVFLPTFRKVFLLTPLPALLHAHIIVWKMGTVVPKITTKTKMAIVAKLKLDRINDAIPKELKIAHNV